MLAETVVKNKVFTKSMQTILKICVSIFTWKQHKASEYLGNDVLYWKQQEILQYWNGSAQILAQLDVRVAG